MNNENSATERKSLGYSEFREEIIRPWLKEIWYLRIPALVAVLSFIIFALVDQTIEVYRIFYQQQLWQHISYSVLLFALAFSICYSGRTISFTRIEKENEDDFFARIKGKDFKLKEITTRILNLLKKETQKKQSKVTALIWLPRFFGLFPLFGYLVGIIRAVGFNIEMCLPITLMGVYWIFIVFQKWVEHRKVKKNEEQKIFVFGEKFEQYTISIFLSTFFFITISMVVNNNVVRGILFCILMSISFILLKQTFNKGSLDFSDILFLFYIGFLTAIAISTDPTKSLSKSFLSPINIVAIFLISFVFFNSYIYKWGYKSKIPILVILVSLAFISSLFNWNDNHDFRKLSNDSQNQKIEKTSNKEEFLDLEDAFENWWEAREQEREEFKQKDKPYPIYIVSAQGGGIFAAYHAALTLSRLQDESPTFANHVFAISGVSGGSFGATAFSSLVKSGIKPVKLEDKAHDLLDRDFLSPLLGAGLFPDFVQRFIPFPINFFDRARALEYAFEQAWKEEIQKDSNPLKDSFYKHWNPKGKAPALVLNTTVVETGDRLVLSPFKIKSPTFNDIRSVACKEDIDFPLSTAAVLSARFPVVTPVGGFEKCNGYPEPIKSRLADGGYFENSGFSTAWEIGQKIEEFLGKEQNKAGDGELNQDNKPTPEYKIIYLAITDDNHIEPDRVTGLNELWSPISALWQTRDARSRNVIQQAEEQIDGDLNQKNDIAEHRFRQLYLTHINGTTPATTSYPVKDRLEKDWLITVAKITAQKEQETVESNSDKDAYRIRLLDPKGKQEWWNDLEISKFNKDKKEIAQRKDDLEKELENFIENIRRLPIDRDKLKKAEEEIASNLLNSPELPLGWYLSETSQKAIKARIGTPNACLSEPNLFSADNNPNNNSCVMKFIVEELS